MESAPKTPLRGPKMAFLCFLGPFPARPKKGVISNFSSRQIMYTFNEMARFLPFSGIWGKNSQNRLF